MGRSATEKKCYTAYSDQVVAEILTRLRPRRPDVRIPAKEKDLLFFRNTRPALELNQPPAQFVPEFFPGSKGTRARS